MIIVEKDRHTIRKQPFFSALKDYNDWLLNSDLNSETNTFISLGDWYTLSTPKPDEIDETERFFKKFKPRKIILAGNHDFSDTDKIWSIYPLQNSLNTEIILKPTIMNIEGKKFVFLPYYSHLKDFPSMKECYSTLTDEYKVSDYICYHFEDETINFGKDKKGIDISYLSGKRLGGHVHCSQKNYEIGMPIISKADECGQKNNLFIIDGSKEYFLDLPKYIDYYSLVYGELPPTVEAKYPLWTIKNSPSRKSAELKYPDLNIYSVEVLSKKEKDLQSKEKKSSIIDIFNRYVSKRSDLTEESVSFLRNSVLKN